MRELTPFGLDRPGQVEPNEMATRLIDADLLTAAELEAWRPRLDVVQGSANVRSLPLGDAGVTIGRAAGNDLVVADDRVSRNHARVVLEGGCWVLEDLNSSNGVRVDGVRVRREQLRSGCRIEIGNATLEFSSTAPELAPETRRALLDTSEVLRSLTEETKAVVAQRLAPRFVAKESTIVHQGEPLTALVFVHRGQLRVVAVNDEGGEKLLDRIHAGECFGERALIAGDSAASTVVADTDALIVELPKAVLAEVLVRRPDESQQVVETVRAKLRTAAIRADERAAQRAAMADGTPFDQAIVGEDGKIVRARQTIEKLAVDDRPVLVVGPQGSGKKTFARHLHRSSQHKAEPYVELALAGMDPGRIAGALFGVEAEGGAPQGEVGHLELLGEGTLAITHAELLDIHQQSLLAGYLKLGWFHRTHGQNTIHSKVRVILVATGTDADVTAALAPELREALHGRTVALPPLTGRLKDIPLLAAHSLAIHSAHAGRKAPALSREALDKLVSYSWPGNVSELDSVMQRAAMVASFDAVIPGDLIFVTAPEQESHKVNLLRNEKLRAILRQPLLMPALTWATMAFVSLVALLTLLGAIQPPGHPLAAAETNPGMMLTWLLWFPLLPLATALIGRVWCGVCPIAGFGDLVARFKRFNYPVPAALKRMGFWSLIAAYIVIEVAEGVFKVDSRPGATLAFLLVLIYLAIAFTVLFERRAFCHYLCPLASWLGAYSTLAPLEIRGNKKVCQTQCGEHTCYKGTEAVPGCPMFLYPAAMTSNSECLLCTNCVRSCENRGVQLNLRPPLSELWRNPAPPLALSVFGAILFGIMARHWVTKLPWWKAIKASTTLSPTTLNLIAFFACIAIAVAGLAAASLLSAAASREKIGTNMARYGVGLIPLAFASHAALMLGGLLSTDLMSLVAWFGGFFAAHPTPVPNVASLLHPAVISFIQGFVLLGGTAAGVIAIVAIARRIDRAEVLARALPHLVLALVLGLGVAVISANRAVKPAPGSPATLPSPAATLSVP